MRGKTGTKWVVEIRKDWTELRIWVEGKENWGNKYTPTNVPDSNNWYTSNTRINGDGFRRERRVMEQDREPPIGRQNNKILKSQTKNMREEDKK